MPKDVPLVHGYSVQNFETYGVLPTLLQQDGFDAQNIFLSAYLEQGAPATGQWFNNVAAKTGAGTQLSGVGIRPR
jgi:hypothetical protein